MRDGHERIAERASNGDGVDGASFRDPVFGAQTAFRQIMRAMASPGRIEHLDGDVLPPAGMGQASATLLLTLCDLETAVWFSDSQSSAARFLRFFADVRLVEAPGEADFAFIHPGGAFPPLGQFRCGDDQYPDRSATLVVEIESFEGGMPVSLTGPGIQDPEVIAPLGLPEDFWAQWSQNHMLYPCGVDLFLICGPAVMGLPRSVHAAANDREVV